MNSIINDTRRRIINGQEIINFDAFSGLFLICVTVRVKSKKQVDVGLQSEKLFIKIDDKTFPDQGAQKELISSPAGFDGDKLNNLSKTVYIITFLRGQAHTLALNGIATLENISISIIDLEKTFKIDLENQAEDGDRRSWITVITDRLPLQATTTTISYARRKRDSDDVKILIDGKNQSSFARGAKHYLWKYIGSLLPWTQNSRTETETFSLNAPVGIHIIEFWADRMPILHDLGINFGIIPIPFSQPTLDNPAWTGSFYDDTELMLLARAIYGEGRDVRLGDDERIGMGWAIRNRVEDKRNRWGRTYHQVILKPKHFSAFNLDDDNRFFVENPLRRNNEIDKQAWVNCYRIANDIIGDKVSDPTFGSNHYYAPGKLSKPKWADEYKFIIQIGNTRFFRRP